MAKQSLTDLMIRKLKPEEKGRYDVWDMRVPGLGVRVFKGGVKSFFLSYHINGKRRRDTLGRYPEISLAEARKLAYTRRAIISSGDDPLEKEKAKKAAKGITFEKALDDFHKLHVQRYNKPSTQYSTMQLLNKDFLPAWNSRLVRDISRSDILSVFDAIVARGSKGTANHAHSAISKFFNWCMSRDLIEVNPCTGVEKPAISQSRNRVLTDSELKEVWFAIQAESYPFGAIASLLILTGQRRGEVTNMEWDQIDWGEGVWKLPDTLTKNKRAHNLPLSQSVLDILCSIPQINKSPYVFPARGSTTTTFSGFGKCKYRIDKKVIIEPWRLHDLRRTTATGMAMLKIPPHIVEKILNHSTGQLGGVAGIYNRFGYLDEMREALDMWADHVMALITEDK